MTLENQLIKQKLACVLSVTKQACRWIRCSNKSTTTVAKIDGLEQIVPSLRPA